MRILFAIVILICSQHAIAQIQKGSFLTGGNLYFNYSESNFENDYNINSLALSAAPRVGFFVIDNFCLGSTVNLSYNKAKYYSTPNDIEYSLNGHSTGIGPFARYYFPVSGLLSIIAEAGYSWNKGKSETATFDINGIDYVDVETKIKELSVSSGLAFFLSKNTSIEFLVNYKNTESKAENGNMFIDDFKRNSFNMSVGFQVYIPKNKE